MVVSCCVPQCKSRKIPGCTLKFHQFPSSSLMVTKWLRVLKIHNKSIKYVKVCSLHFKEDDYKTVLKSSDARRYLKENAVPSRNLPKTSHGLKRKEITTSSVESPERIEFSSDESEDDAIIPEAVLYIDTDIEEDIQIDVPDKNEVVTKSTSKKNMSVHTESAKLEPISLYYDRLSDEQFKRYTGLPYNRFKKLFLFLGETTASPFDEYLSKQDQLILCLIKYRQNIIFSIIGDMYGLSEIVTRKIFNHWTLIMNAAFKKINWWVLKPKKPDVYTVYLECLEITTQHGAQNTNVNQQSWFSQYKNKNTLKYMIGLDEKGIVIFCSQVFPGSSSDRYIVEQCGILDQLKKGDVVLADRLFDIDDLLESRRATLHVTELSFKQIEVSKDAIATRIAESRNIAVERIIGLSKFNKILTHTNLWPYSNEIIYVGNMLNNLKKIIVNSIVSL